jgi:hypothetical protein
MELSLSLQAQEMCLVFGFFYFGDLCRVPVFSPE